MKLSLLIVNYNTELFICELLTSLLFQTLLTDQYELIIVNNSQNDNLILAIDEQKFKQKLPLTIYQSDANIGFGRAMNLAFSYAKGEHILLINPDVKLLQDNYLADLLDFAKQNPNYGAISTQILNSNQHDGSTYYAYEFGQTLGFDGEICWFEGSLLLIRQEVFAKLKGFDPDFFMYCEDVDLCLRIKKMGLELIKNNTLKVYHVGGASEPSHDKNYYKRRIESQLLFAKKHYGDDLFFKLIGQLNCKSRKRWYFYKITSLFVKKHHRHLLKNQVFYELSTPYLTK